MNIKLLLKEIKAVIFDADNTLLATNEFVIRNLKKTVMRLQTNGQNIIMPSDEKITAVLAKNLPFEQIFTELFNELSEISLANYREQAVNESYQATTGAVEAVNELITAGFVVGIVTNRVKMLAERLQQAGFDSTKFSFICQPPADEFRKPHPRSLDIALKFLKEKNIYPDQTVMFGDHPDDYYPAKYNGLKFVGVLQGGTSRQEFTMLGLENKIIVDNLIDVITTLEQMVMVHTYQTSLSRTSALDGRHAIFTYSLRHYFSESALHQYRIKIEIEHLIALSDFFSGTVIRRLSDEEKKQLKLLYENFSWHESYEILQYDHLGRGNIGPTEHDVKSCELWLKEKLTDTNLADLIPYLHYFVTSEDINNLAYKLMLKDAIKEIFYPTIIEITDRLGELANKYIPDPVMSRTHLQPASPTTFGKIFANYLSRLTDGLTQLNKLQFKGKLNGAVGNYNCFVAVYPDLDWPGYSVTLTEHLGLENEMWTDQRGSHTDMISVFQALQTIGNIIRDLAGDLSLYAGFGTMYFAKVDSHAGSSVMPHKINPWFAEVAEGNIKKANYLINGLSNELDVSRLQRDLSDHDWERSYGEAFGYILVAMEHLKIALSLIIPNTDFAYQELINHPEVVTEAIQTILRKNKVESAYDLLKKEFRGQKPTSEDIRSFIMKLPVADLVKGEILAVCNPENYLGLSVELTQKAIEKYNNFKNKS